MLGFDRYQERLTLSAANTPDTMMISSPQGTDQRDHAFDLGSAQSSLQRPTDLCQWSIHVRFALYDPIESPPPTPQVNLDPDNEQSWTEWSTSSDPILFPKKLQDGLDNNDFSNVTSKELPIAVTQIVRAAQHSPNELLKEAFGFSIMAGNIDLIMGLLQQIEVAGVDVGGLYPFHLATSYLGGSKTCCNVLYAMLHSLHYKTTRTLYVNDLGHTILDNLMISILKAHTSCVPHMVDHVFRKEKRFAGAVVDICGRWDADSDCVRVLLANGNPAIPFEWKHMFCHTSVQTICHCIGALFENRWHSYINTPSGLFLKRCSQCGQKLQLLALHTLIVTAFHLAQHGCQGENLFGILACLLCLLGKGANPLLKAHVSGQALLTTTQADVCDHEELDPLELTDRVPDSFTSTWSREVIVGWEILRHVLRRSQAEWSPRQSQQRSPPERERHDDEFSDFIEYSDEEMSVDDGLSTDEKLLTNCTKVDYHERNFFGRNKVVATLWAAVQTELLTYRRLGSGDSWISSNFSMHDLLGSLDGGTDIRIGLVQKTMMKSFCDCGRFFEARDDGFACGDEASAYYFSNLEDWNRSTHIDCPYYLMEL